MPPPHPLPRSFVDTVPDDDAPAQCFPMSSGEAQVGILAFPPDYFTFPGPDSQVAVVEVALHADVLGRTSLDLVCTSEGTVAAIRMSNLPPPPA